jgi:hypothetical protein
LDPFRIENQKETKEKEEKTSINQAMKTKQNNSILF